MTNSKARFVKQIEEATGLTATSIEDRPAYSTLKLGKFVVVDIFHSSRVGWKVWHVRINSDVQDKLYELHLKS